MRLRIAGFILVGEGGERFSMRARNYRLQKATRYGIGQRKALTQSARNGWLRDSVFQNKDSADYRPNYGKTYTERQLKIINEEISVDDVSNTELVILMRKAKAIEDFEVASKVQKLHDLKNYVESYQFTYSPEEAKDVLQALTPWKIDWEP